MKKMWKDILRYFILIMVSWFTIDVTYLIVNYALLSKEIDTQTASLLGASQTSILATWGFVIKKFFETKVDL